MKRRSNEPNSNIPIIQHFPECQNFRESRQLSIYAVSPGESGNLVLDKNAELVRRIFQMAADGWSISQITKYLNENEITTQNEKNFSRSTVSRILHNHAYKGDYICHRYYVNNQRKLVRNKGEKQMYYIHHDHVAIVSEELWGKAQEKLEL